VIKDNTLLAAASVNLIGNSGFEIGSDMELNFLLKKKGKQRGKLYIRANYLKPD